MSASLLFNIKSQSTELEKQHATCWYITITLNIFNLREREKRDKRDGKKRKETDKEKDRKTDKQKQYSIDKVEWENRAHNL